MDLQFREPITDGAVLLVGDGDLSFSVAFQKLYGNSFEDLICTCYETTSTASQKYPNFTENVNILRANGAIVVAAIDATQLEKSFHEKLFTHVIFNFPHSGGKSNIKKSRLLLDSFFRSAVKCMKNDGKILVTLCKGQGGTDADNPKREWHNSWQVTALAANSGLILSSVNVFEGAKFFKQYSATGYRSQNKAFNTEDSLVHTFIKSCLPPPPGEVLFGEHDLANCEVSRDFCSLLKSAWNLSTWTCQIDESSDVSQGLPRTIGLFSITARFNCPAIYSEKFDPIYFGEMTQLIKDNNIIKVTTTDGSLTNQYSVGIVENDILCIDIAKTLRLILNVDDNRQYIYATSPVDFIPYCTNHFTCKIPTSRSVYPPIYKFDISFWLCPGYMVGDFLGLIRRISNGLVKEVLLIDEYYHVQTQSKSHCYRISYQSLNGALSYSIAFQYYQFLRSQCESRLHVILR